MKYKRPPKSEGGAKGTDKTIVGTPDSFIILPNGNYIFIEYTTQQTGVGKKFLGDLVKNFDEKETGIPISKIETIYLCYNSQLSPDNTNKIIEFCSSKSTDVEFIDIDTLKHEIYYYPKLAKDFLNVETDTEQILRPADFIVELENKGTSQTNIFIGREDELKELTGLLGANSIIVLSGKSGIGKTRIAREVAEKFVKKNEDYEFLCICNKGQPIYHDLKSYFNPGHKYIVIVDDANRISDFPSVARLSRLENCEVKIIVTVRDYVFEKIERHLQTENYFYSVFELAPLENPQVKNILTSLRITSPFCIDKITNIADGNPRLVMMAADHALADNDCNKLNDVTDIYDKFFEPLISKGKLNDKNLLSVLGIVCFFRVIDKSNKVWIDRIYKDFGVNENEFWDCIKRLHSLELVNLYEKNVVKVADQVLANYFFYLVFIKREILDFSIILDNYLFDLRDKVIESLYPIIKHFKSDEILKIISPKIDDKYNEIKTDDKMLMIFFEVFGFCKLEELLLFIQHGIEKLPDPNPATLKYNLREKGSSNHWYYDLNYPFLKPLKTLGQHPNDNFQISLDLIFRYVRKVPELLPAVIKYFEGHLIFDEKDHGYEYWRQIELFNFLYRKIEECENNELFVDVLIEIAPKFLRTQFQQSKGGRKGDTIQIYQLMILRTPEIEQLRKKIFERIFNLIPIYPDKVLSFLEKYCSTWDHEPQIELYEYDSQFIISFIENKLSPENFRHCQFVRGYLKKLEKLKISLSYSDILLKKFRNKKFELNKILSFNQTDWREIDKESSGNEFKIYNRKKLANHFKAYKLEDYFSLVDDIEELMELNKRDRHNIICSAFESILLNLFDKSPEYCLETVRYLFETNNSINFCSDRIIKKLIQYFSTEKIFILIDENEFNDKNRWLLQFFMLLDVNQVNEFYKNRLLELYKSIDDSQYLFFDFLKKYKVVEPKIFAKVFTILLERIKEENYNLDFYFSDFFEKYHTEFNGEFELVKEMYSYCYSYCNSAFDRKGIYFAKLYQRDNDFLFVFLKELLKDKHIMSHDDLKFAFYFIWDHNNAEEIITKIIESVTELAILSIGDDLVSKFFPSGKLSPRIDAFLTKYIQENSEHKGEMHIIFTVIRMCYPDKRIKYLKELMTYNCDKEFWNHLPITRGSFSGIVSSRIPFYEAQIEFWQFALPIFSGKVEYLKLKQLVQSKIKSLQNQIEHELKRNFINDY